MARARRTRTSSRRGPKNQIWVSTVFEAQSFDDTPVVETSVLSGSQWQSEVGLTRATVISIRGWLSLSYDSTQTVANRAFMLFYLTDIDAPIMLAGTNGPADALGYIEDVMWTGGWQVPIGKAGSVEQSTGKEFSLDIKTMRKVTSDQQIRLALAAGTGGSTFIMSGIVRLLVRRGVS